MNRWIFVIILSSISALNYVETEDLKGRIDELSSSLIYNCQIDSNN